MNRITPAQVHAIQLAHADGLLDNAIAERAGVSVATVKRYRTKLGLETHCVTTLRGREGERRVAEVARLAGLEVQWRERDGERHDLIIGGLRVDVKAAMQDENDTWRFSLPTIRASYYGRYSYPKDYEQDCEVVALVCLRLDGLEPSIYLLGTKNLLEEIRIRPGLLTSEPVMALAVSPDHMSTLGRVFLALVYISQANN